jgi:signal peptidase I
MRSASKFKAALRPSPVKLDQIATKLESFVNTLAEFSSSGLPFQGFPDKSSSQPLEMQSEPREIDEPRKAVLATKLLISGAVLVLVAIGIVGALAGAHALGLIGYYTFPTNSMTPTIPDHWKVLVEGFSYVFRGPQRGDIVVYKSDERPGVAGMRFVKRIVGMPGDVLERESDHLLINGKAPADYQPVLKVLGRLPFSSTARYLGDNGTRCEVPVGQYFVLGDNVAVSLDSRFHGPVPREAILGKVFFIFR